MIKPTIEKSIADLDAQIEAAEKAGGARQQLAILMGSIAPLESRKQAILQEIGQEECRLDEMKKALANGESRLNQLRFDPARVEAVLANGGRGTQSGAQIVVLNFDRAILALTWWLKHAPEKIAEKERSIANLKARRSAIATEISKFESDRSRLASEVEKLDLEIPPGHELATIDRDDPRAIRTTFRRQTLANPSP